MARAAFIRSKPVIVINTIGHVEHGKTTLRSAIYMTLDGRRRVCIRCIIEEEPSQREIEEDKSSKQAIIINYPDVVYDTASRRYVHLDFSKYSDYVKAILTGTVDAAIVVISAVDGVTPQLQEQMMLLHQVGIRHIVVFINKKDLVDDELLKLVKLEVREFLSSYGLSENEVPIVAGSALQALQAVTDNPKLQRGDNKWLDDIYELLDAFDSYIPVPVPYNDRPFLMAVEDVFEIKGNGTVIAGTVERGQIHRNDAVEIVGIKATRSATINDFKIFGKSINEALAGDSLSLLLDGIKKDEIERGMALAFPGSIAAHTQFEAQVYVLNSEEKGKLDCEDKPLFPGDSFDFYIRNINVTGTINSLIADDGSVVEWVLPGQRIAMSVQLQIPIAMEQGVHFRMRKDNNDIGLGIVYKILS